MDPAIAVGLALGLLFWGWIIWEGLRGYFPRSPAGTTIAVDDPGLGGMPMLVSERYRLRGRPDELRRLSDGRLVPVEIKSSRTSRGGPLPSHRAQLLAYCLLVEEEFRVPPPYGILCYGDGTEFRVAWDARARAEVLAGLARLGGHYMGEADPSPGKCRACRFSLACSGTARLG